jgi:hypothetical protein
LSLQITDTTKVYGSPDPVFEYTISEGQLFWADSIGGTPQREEGEDAGTYQIGQGSLTAGPNYTTSVSEGVLTITPASLTLSIADTAKIYGSPDPVFTYSVSDGQLYWNDAVEGTPQRDEGESVGSYLIGEGTLNAGPNYNTTVLNGHLTINQAALTLTVNDANKIYGSLDPDFTYSITEGQLFWTDAVEGTPQRETGESAGTYQIGQGTLTAGSNYATTINDGVFTINKAELVIKADDQYIYSTDPLPDMTFTYSGFKFSDTPETVLASNEPGYTISPEYQGDPGEYQIQPYASPVNYFITSVPGSLYVNPGKRFTRAVWPILTCVDELVGDPSGYTYIAHFRYENKNSVNVYIPAGNDNFVTSKGKFMVTNQPVVFLPGGGTFDVLFDGKLLAWTVRSLDILGLRLPLTSIASRISSKCGGKSALSLEPATINTGDTEIDLNGKIYPNPVTDKVTIEMNGLPDDVSKVAIMDHRGTGYPVSIISRYENHLELDMSALPPGVYIISVNTGLITRQFKVIKN